jgi:hypothetical protein
MGFFIMRVRLENWDLVNGDLYSSFIRAFSVEITTNRGKVLERFVTKIFTMQI